MEWYLKVVRDNYANFNGRASRQEYWMFYLFNTIFFIGLMVIEAVLGIAVLSMIYGLAVFIPGLGAGIRRLHDVGKSGWFLLILLIPLVGAIWLIVLVASKSNPGENQYGTEPK